MGREGSEAGAAEAPTPHALQRDNRGDRARGRLVRGVPRAPDAPSPDALQDAGGSGLESEAEILLSSPRMRSVSRAGVVARGVLASGESCAPAPECWGCVMHMSRPFHVACHVESSA